MKLITILLSINLFAVHFPFLKKKAKIGICAEPKVVYCEETFSDQDILQNLDEWQRSFGRQEPSDKKDDGMDVIKIMKYISGNERFLEHHRKILVCDESGKLRSVAIYTESDTSLYLEYFISSPNNEFEKFSGAGKAALMKLFEKSLEKNKRSIELTSTRTAESFYKRFGFENISGRKFEIPIEKIQSQLINTNWTQVTRFPEITSAPTL